MSLQGWLRISMYYKDKYGQYTPYKGDYRSICAYKDTQSQYTSLHLKSKTHYFKLTFNV